MKIRQATLQDISLIRQLADIAFRHTYRDILSPEQMEYMMEWMYSEESLTRQMGEEGHCYFLAQDEDTFLGYVSVSQEGEDLYHLQKIYILPEHQKEGIGKVLFHHALSYIKDIHPTPCWVELNVNRANPAVGFYHKMGLHILRQGDFPIGNGFFMNDYIMGIELK